MIKEALNKLADNILPDKTELMESFDEIFSGIADEIMATSFISLLCNFLKGDNSCEILYSCTSSANNAVSKVNCGVSIDSLLQISSMSTNKEYANIPFARDIILSANNVPVINCQKSVLHKTDNTIDLLEKYRIEITNKNKDNKRYETDNFEKTNYMYLMLDSEENYIKYTDTISNKLCLYNILDITNCFINPCCAKNILFNCKNSLEVEKFAKLCIELQYHNSLVYSSDQNLPFISPEKESFIAEAWKNKIFSYKLALDMIELNQHELKELKIENSNEDFELINNLFNAKLKDTAIYDTVVVNSALALYIIKKADSLMDGIRLSKATIDNKIALEKLNSLNIQQSNI